MNNYIRTMMSEIDAPSTILRDEHPGFLLSLMIISSYVIQADGKIMHSELEYLRGFLTENYCIEKKEKYVGLLLKLFVESKKYSHEEWVSKIKDCTVELNDYTTEEQRILLMSFLIKIVKADKKIEVTEIQALRDVAEWLRVDIALSERIDNLKIEEIWTWGM
ncbi:MAG: TerB family tellurite resistance protein [Prevotella sp.]|nr:TerB family tellurite resistance protein [Prevotella sp.]